MRKRFSQGEEVLTEDLHHFNVLLVLITVSMKMSGVASTLKLFPANQDTGISHPKSYHLCYSKGMRHNKQ